MRRSRWTVAMVAAVTVAAAATLRVRPTAAQDAPAAGGVDAAFAAKTLRPPAVPLVTSDPYLSLWSEADHLTDNNTRHWTGRPQPLYSMVRVDGTAYRLMGADPEGVAAMPQVGVRVSPTRTVYDFEGAGVHVTLTFLSPLLPHDLDVMSRPVTYLTWDVRAVDGGPHAVQLMDATSGLLTVNEPTQKVTWGREAAGDLRLLRIGAAGQMPLAHAGDDVRIDWGYAYTAAEGKGSTAAIGTAGDVFAAFAANGTVPADDAAAQPTAASEQAMCAVDFDLGTVTAEPVTRRVMLGYDEVKAINYFGRPLSPYWRRNGATPADLFQAAAKDYPALVKRCDEFDRELLADARKVGGDDYADMIALAYRQCWAGCGIAADQHGQPLLFTKENTSNGDIATVDVIFPMDPVWVLLSPSLAKSSLAAVLQYGSSPRWKFPNAPHDLGTYPIVRGTDDGGEGMPVEESGNMLILCDAIAKADGNADWVTPWWPTLTKWAAYLEQYGLDPGSQLCTDDFMGELAHNSNLSVKAIVALAAYGDLCRMRGDTANADRYAGLAKADVEHWIKVADAGDHSLLAFDKPGTWSQKYNLVWDQVLGLNVFPPEVRAKEVAFYKTQLQPYGLPLDSRTKITESPWTLWSATLATDDADFRTLIGPLHRYLNQTTARQPFADSYDSDKIGSVGMHARPVIGSVFMKLLADGPTWKKWATGDKATVGGWAPLPKPAVVTVVLPTAVTEPAEWRYTTAKPAGDEWTRPGFDAAEWRTGKSGFGTRGTPGLVYGTQWKTDDIWLRREVTVPANVDAGPGELTWYIQHDEDVEVYVDGVLAGAESGFNTGYYPVPVTPAGKALLKPGATVLLAVHCHQTTGGQGVDVGLAKVQEPKE